MCVWAPCDRGEDLHEAVDLVCDDFAVVNAPFSGVLVGPVGRQGPDGLQSDGVKVLSDGKRVQLNVSSGVFMYFFI